MAAGVGGKDGIIGKGDVVGDLHRVKEEIDQFGLSEAEESSRPSAPSAAAPGRGRIKDILSDPSLSIEDKIQLVLELMTEDLDGSIEGVMEQIAAKQDELAGIKDTAAASEKKEDKAIAKKESAANRSIEQLNLKLQKLTERRKQMFDLMTTMSGKFNEMAKAAIQNLARA